METRRINNEDIEMVVEAMKGAIEPPLIEELKKALEQDLNTESPYKWFMVIKEIKCHDSVEKHIGVYRTHITMDIPVEDRYHKFADYDILVDNVYVANGPKNLAYETLKAVVEGVIDYYRDTLVQVENKPRIFFKCKVEKIYRICLTNPFGVYTFMELGTSRAYNGYSLFLMNRENFLQSIALGGKKPFCLV